MSKSTTKQIQQLAKLLAESHAFLEQDDAQSRERFTEATRQVKGRGRKLRERDLIDMPNPQPPSSNHREPDASQLTFQPRKQNQIINEGKKTMFAEQTMTARRSQAPSWMRAMLAATLLAVVLVGVILMGSVLDGDTLSVSFIRSAAEVNQDAFTLYIDEVWNQGNVALLHDLATEGVVYHDTTLAEDVVGIDGVSQLVTNYRAAMLDFTYSIDAMSIDADRVWAQITATGTHTNALELGEGITIPASLNTASWSVTIVSRFEDGKIAETWVQADSLDLMQQFGAMSSLVQQTTEAQNIETIRQFYDLVNTREFEAAFEAAYAPTWIWHHPYTRATFNADPAGSANYLRQIERSFPDFTYTIESIAATGDVIFVKLTLTGTFETSFVPTSTSDVCAPTDEEAGWEEIRILRFEDGLIIEDWLYLDDPMANEPELYCGS